MKAFKKFLEDIDYYKIPGLSQEPIKSKVVIPPTKVKKKKVDYYKFGIERVREQFMEGQVGSDRLLGGLMRKVHSDAQKKYDRDKLKPQQTLKKV